MQSAFLIFFGAGLVGLAWLGSLAIKHGWGWVLARAHAKQARIEAAIKASAGAGLSAIEPRLTAIEDQFASLAALKNDVAALKTKLGL